MPTKIYHIKMNDFWINVSYSPPSLPTSKNKEIESAKNEINALQITSPISKSQKLLPFHRADFRTLTANLLWTWLRTPLLNWMNSYWSVRKSARWKGSSFCDFEIGLVVIWRHLSNFWQIRFLCFLTWVLRRTVANINPKIIHFDAVDFNGHHSKKL